MADCQPAVIYGGYDCQFVEDVPDHLTCIVCLGAFREPHLLSCCGKKVCYNCITLIKNAEQACPHCREQQFNTMLDKDFNRQVRNLRVYCSKRDSGCQWAGELNQLEKHTSEVCRYTEVPCKWTCGQLVSRDRLEEHEQDQCPLRPHEVKLQRAVDKMEERLKALETNCDGQRQEIDRLKECLAESKEDRIAEKKEFTELLEKERERVEQLVKEVDGRGQQVAKELRGLINEQEKKVGVAKEWAEQHTTEQHKQIRTELDDLTSRHDNLKAQFQETSTQITDKINKIADGTTQQLVKINNESSNLYATKASIRALQDILERISRHGVQAPEWQLPVPVSALTNVAPCQFTMLHYSAHRSAKKTWYSPPFYNEAGGYKFCLRVDSQGMLEGKQTHLSVWVYVMRGLHDEALEWPFTGKVTVQLLNWKLDRGHIQNIIAFDDQAGSKVRQRVTAGECAATGRGSSRFVSHATLSEHMAGGSNPNVELVKNDCLCFKISKVEIQ